MTHSNGKPKKPGKKSPSQSPTKPQNGQIVPRPNGHGALRYGSLPGNTPGTGRPKDEIREKLMHLVNGKGVPFLDQLLDGKVLVRLVHQCEHCGKKAKGPLTSPELEDLLAKITVSVDQRLKGLDPCLRYGIGTRDELDIRSHPEVQRFVSVHAQATREIAGDDLYRKIAQRVQELAA